MMQRDGARSPQINGATQNPPWFRPRRPPVANDPENMVAPVVSSGPRVGDQVQCSARLVTPGAGRRKVTEANC